MVGYNGNQFFTSEGTKDEKQFFAEILDDAEIEEPTTSRTEQATDDLYSQGF